MLGTGDTVYVIDPDEAVHDALAALIGSSAANVECYHTAEEFLLAKAPFHDLHGCLLVEVNLPGMGALALIRQLREQDDRFPVIVLASTSDRDIADQAIKAGAADFLYKPLTSGPLLDRLHCVAKGSEADAQHPNQFCNNNPQWREQ